MNHVSYGSEIIPISDAELRNEFDRLLNSDPDKTEIWATKFLRRYRDSNCKDKESLELAIRCTHRSTPLQKLLFRVYSRHFAQENGEILQAFQRAYERTELLAVHVSCRARLHLACASVESFPEQEGLQHLTVVGRGSARHDARYDFDPVHRLLTVSAPDNYEGLSLKMAAVFRFLGFGGVASCMMKLDDDIVCNPDKFSVAPLIDRIIRHDYMGRVNRACEYGIHRWWHLGKCEDPELDRSPYSLIVDCSYANGPAYFLSPRSINMLAKASIYLYQAFEIEFSYEDVAVGKILKSFGLEPHHDDPLEAGILSVAGRQNT